AEKQDEMEGIAQQLIRNGTTRAVADAPNDAVRNCAFATGRIKFCLNSTRCILTFYPPRRISSRAGGWGGIMARFDHVRKYVTFGAAFIVAITAAAEPPPPESFDIVHCCHPRDDS